VEEAGVPGESYLTTHTSLSPIRCGFTPGFVNYKKGCTRLTAASDKVYQLLAHGRWFSPGTPASSTTKTGRHDIAEILLKVALKCQKSKSNLALVKDDQYLNPVKNVIMMTKKNYCAKENIQKTSSIKSR
jgi:hypothetical protein